MWGGPCLIRWGSSEKGLKSLEVEGILPPSCLQNFSWVSSLLIFPADFRLLSFKISLLISVSLSLSLRVCVFKVDLCTTQVWTVHVQLHADTGCFFFNFVLLYMIHSWIQESRIIDVEKLLIWGTNYRLYVDFLLYEGLVPLIPMLFKAQLYINTHKHLHIHTHTHTHTHTHILLVLFLWRTLINTLAKNTAQCIYAPTIP